MLSFANVMHLFAHMVAAFFSSKKAESFAQCIQQGDAWFNL